ncbi:MAG: hypothetical protein P8X64_03210 [Anaerolineales bacterium]|jgi:hypothetical protein
MWLQEAAANTFGYMVLGYAVILGTMTLFILSIALRTRSLRRDEELLDELEQ